MAVHTRNQPAGARGEPEALDPAHAIVVILGGGRGARLFPLTTPRAKPAVSFAGKYRLIDIPLTNCLRSWFEKIFILTQFNSFSLNRHIWQTYAHELRRDSYIDIVAAEQTEDNPNWFQGTADAVRQSLRHILPRRPRYVLILSGDQIYSMDYRDLLAHHVEHGNDVTIAAKYSNEDEIRRMGIVKVAPDLRVVDFFEKPQDPALVAEYRLDRLQLAHPQGQPYLCSMGIYLFDTDALVAGLNNDEEDFGKSVIPRMAKNCRIGCFPFAGYWEDVGTIKAFYLANMVWRRGEGIAKTFEEGASIITHARHLSPTRIDGTRIEDSIVAEGGRLEAERLTRCVIGVRSRIARGTVIEDSIIMGNDEYRPGGFEIGEHCRIRRAIVDKNAVIGDGSVVVNERGVEEADTELYSIRAGIVVVPKGVILPPGTRI